MEIRYSRNLILFHTFGSKKLIPKGYLEIDENILEDLVLENFGDNGNNKIRNVAAGTDATDAVNVSQLKD